MLTQTGGTLGAPLDLSQYTDAKHYRIPTSEGARAYYGLLTLTPPDGDTTQFALTSCASSADGSSGLSRPEGRVVTARGRRHRGSARSNLAKPGSSKICSVTSGADRVAPPRGCRRPSGGAPSAAEGSNAADRLVLVVLLRAERDGAAGARQPRRHRHQHARPALRSDRRRLPERDGRLARHRRGVRRQRANGARRRFVSVDSSRRSGSRRSSRKSNRISSDRIRTGSSKMPTARRCVPIASRSADGVAVRGTRSTARIPDAQSHLERVFRTMRTEWGCTYFKLDANFWGAMHGGRFHDARATRVEAYRRGMAGRRSRRGRQLPPRLQSPDVAVARASSTDRAARTTSSARGIASRPPDCRTCSATGRTGVCGGTIRMRLCWRAI